MAQELQIFRGQELTFIAPSGHEFTIRQQNGDDDEILSLIDENHKEESIKNFNKFLSSIVGHNSINNKAYLDQKEVQRMKLNDKYYILFKSRLHSIGKELKFDAKCPNKSCGHTHKYREDLTKYDTDLANYIEPTLNEDGEPSGFKFQIKPTKTGTAETVDFTTSTGKNLRYTCLNIAAELVTSKLKVISENTELSARDLSIKNPQTGEYDVLSSYNIFSKPEMIEIQAHIRNNDSQWLMLSEITCPKCERVWHIPFLYAKDFFFPGEI